MKTDHSSRRGCITLLLISVLTPRVLLLAMLRQEEPNPTSLLQGVESVRLQIPPSTLRLKSSYRDVLVTNETEMTVDFDGQLRGFTYKSIDEPYRTVFDGSRVVVYDEALRQAQLRNPDRQNHMRLWDPRVFGLTTYYHWEDSLEKTMPYRDAAKVELIGRETVGELLAWHVRLAIVKPHGSWTIDYWIDHTNNFRVYRKDYNCVQTFSYYENENYPWLPSRVVGKEYPDRAGTVLESQREWRILDAKAHVTFPKERWSLGGMGIKAGTDVLDEGSMKRVGRWDGKRLAPSADVPRKYTVGIWGYVVMVAMVVAPAILVWRSKRGPRRVGPAGSP